MLLALRKLIHLCDGHHIRPFLRFKPSFKFQILFHPASPSVQKDKAELQRLTIEQVPFDQPPPLFLHAPWNLSETIAREIGKTKPLADLIEIDQLSPARRRTGKRQTLPLLGARFSGAAPGG